MTVLLRGLILHTPQNPFRTDRALEAFSDGGLALRDGQIVALGSFSEVRKQYPEAPVQDCREGVLLPGLVDTHVHYPQTRVIGAMGYSLLDWLEKRTLPLEARLSDNKLARELAREFVGLLLRNGTTTALVFGSHFQGATANLFGAAEDVGLRLIAGQICSDRMLRPELHTTPERSYAEQKMLIQRFHGRGKLRYAVTPASPSRPRRGCSRSARPSCRSTPTCTSPPTSTRTSRRSAPWPSFSPGAGTTCTPTTALAW